MQIGVPRSRLAALAASRLFVIFYTCIMSLHGALADGSAAHLVANELDGYDLDLEFGNTYEPSFAPFDRSYLGRRASVISALENNAKVTSNLERGVAACYQLKKSTVFGSSGSGNAARGVEIATDENDLASRQEKEQKVVYISANTCLQPHRAPGHDDEPINPPQLTLLISNSSQLGCPDMSMANTPGVEQKEFDHGAVMLSRNFTDDLYISIQAPNVSSMYEDIYNFELAASVDDYYHRYETKEGQLLWLDSDATSAIMVSKNLTTNSDKTEGIMDQGLRYEFFIDNQQFPRLKGLNYSSCGLRSQAQISKAPDGSGNLEQLVHMKMTTRGQGGFPKQQIFVTGLNDTTKYRGFLIGGPNTTEIGKRADAVVGGGGTVFASANFTTASGTTCKVVTDLDFCDEIQYAVPGNMETFKEDGALAKKYDDYAKEMYQNFEKALMQVQCEAPSTKAYSLMKSCDDCRKSYKKWLCTVAMPRCEDYSTVDSYSIVRNAGQPFPNGTMLPAEDLEKFKEPAFNSSRNKFIDENIAPGPYKELLPCDDLCYDVVQSCPSVLEFACPLRSFREYPSSYAKRDPDGREVTCNYPGEPRTRVSAAAGVVWNAAFMGCMLLLSTALIC